MLERVEYRRRVAEAVLLNPKTTMSSIIDGASQNHCTIPHTGSANVEFPNGLEQHIEGVLTHGHGFSIAHFLPLMQIQILLYTVYCGNWRDGEIITMAIILRFGTYKLMAAVRMRINMCSQL